MVADLAPNVYLNAGPDFFPSLDERSPFDFEIIIKGSQTRKEFLDRRAQVEGWLNAWLRPSGLVVGEFFILWEDEPPLRYGGPIGGDVTRDPKTGLPVKERLAGEDRISGSLCQIEHAFGVNGNE